MKIKSAGVCRMSFRIALMIPALAVARDSLAAVYPYGVCAHVTRSERTPERLHGTLLSMELAGMKYVRSDFDAWRIPHKNGTRDFSYYDDLIRELEAHGVTLLPILYGVENPPKDMTRYADYIKAIVRHYGKRLPVVEIWNEANLDGFFRGADPIRYAETLKTAYDAVKSVDPSVLVAYTGTSEIPLDWIRKTFEAGAAQAFDIMNVHPYSHPMRPEGSMDCKTEKLRVLMAEFGIGDKPIWFTEIGWPTQSASISVPHILLAGLKVARPEQKAWRVIIADDAVETPSVTSVEYGRSLDLLLPSGSTVSVCGQTETIRRLKAGDADAVVYPFDETFPDDTVDAVNDFIRDGGVFVDFGGLPCWFGRRNGEAVKGAQHGGRFGRFPFGYCAWWTGTNIPRQVQSFATPRGLAAGVKQEPTGFKAERFLTPGRAGKDAEWIPLVTGKALDGTELVSAAVIRYHDTRKGAAVLCTLRGRGAIGTNSEENQARYTARGLSIAFAEGVEAYFTYNLRAGNLRSGGVDPFYSEHHFGLMQEDFIPKPAFSAYAAFTRARPAGSVQKPGAWHDEKRSVYFPQWTRPGGVKAGMIWKLGEDERRVCRFAGGEPIFRNLYGRRIAVRQLAPGVCELVLGESPVYFSGAELADGACLSVSAAGR